MLTSTRATAIPAPDFRLNVLSSSKDFDFVACIEPTSKGEDVVPWATGNFSLLQELLHKYGVIVLRGYSADTVAFSKVADMFSEVACKQQGQISPRTHIHGTVYTSTNFPPQYPIGQHHENCYDLHPPSHIFFYCNVPAATGGETVVVDARALYRRLDPEMIAKFEKLGVKYVRNFTNSSPYKTRTETFLVDSEEELERYCKEHGIECETVNGFLRASQVRGATTVHPKTGDRAFFNVAHIWHWSSIMGAARAFGGDIAERILKTAPGEQWGNALYGDGTDIEPSILEDINNLYREEQVAIGWEKNDIVIVDNVLATHGRKPFTGERQIQVTVRDPSKTPYFPCGGQPVQLWKEPV